VAVLLRRNGNYLEAIKRYMKILKEQDLIGLIGDLNKEQTAAKRLKSVAEFESVISRCREICEKYEEETKDEGWFTLIEGLNSFLVSIGTTYEKQAGEKIDREDLECV